MAYGHRIEEEEGYGGGGGGRKKKKKVNYLTFKTYSLEVPLYNLNPQPRLKIRESAVNY